MTIVPLVVGYFAIQWNRANFLGKSPEQIVAMGRDKWTELYGKKFGEGTHQSSEAQEKFGIALQNLNDRAIQRLPRTRQVWLKEVRHTTKEFAFEAHQIGSSLTGGGTMWQTFDATILPDVEQAISDCIINKPLSATRLKSFESEFQLLDKVVLEAKLKDNPQEFSDLMKHRKTLANKQTKLLSLLDKGKENDANRIKIYMHRKIEVARGGDV